MSPGYDRPDQPDFRRTISNECIFCHDGYPAEQQLAFNSDAPVLGSQPPEGIDCQRCHGPGRAHVDAAGSGRSGAEAIRRAIVNPARLNRDRAIEVCMQCHLETTSRLLPNAIRRYDRGPFSYRPGAPLGGYSFYFDHAPGTGQDDKFEIAHAAYRLRKSACFQAGRMTCTTCHDPHRTERGPDAARHYVAVCRNCHGSAHRAGMPASGSCIDCHMPKRRAEDAVHVSMTDHYIQRRKPSRDLLAALQESGDAAQRYSGPVEMYYPPFRGTVEDELYLAVAQVQHGANLEDGVRRLQAAIGKFAPSAPEFYFELGRAYVKAGRPKEAIPWFAEALRRRPRFRVAATELAVAFSGTGNAARATEVLEKAAAGESADATALTNLGNLYLQQGQIDRADHVLERAVQSNPDLAEAHNVLGLVRSHKGDRAAAEQQFRAAICLQPDLAEAHTNLAELLAAADNYAEAAFHASKAVRSNPADAGAHHTYGLILLMTHSYKGAAAELQRAVELDPKLAQAHSDLADVLAAQGRTESAADQYRQAIQLKPDFAEAHLALGNLLARRGDTAEARTHYERAAESSDPSIRASALQALHSGLAAGSANRGSEGHVDTRR